MKLSTAAIIIGIATTPALAIRTKRLRTSSLHDNDAYNEIEVFGRGLNEELALSMPSAENVESGVDFGKKGDDEDGCSDSKESKKSKNEKVRAPLPTYFS